MGMLPSKEELKQNEVAGPTGQNFSPGEVGKIRTDTPVSEHEAYFQQNNAAQEEMIEDYVQADLGKSLPYKVFGCGGFGRSVVDAYARELPEQEFTVFDSTEYEPSCENISAMSIPGLDGSAKVRALNYNAIKKFISSTVEQLEFGKINIVINSAAGGTGSIVAPLLMKEIYRKGKQAILLTLVDKSSEIDTRNSINSLMSFESMVQDAYVPVVLFDNSLGKPAVDRGIKVVLNALDVVLSRRFNKLDTADRLVFFAPSTGSANVKKGFKLLGVSTNPDGAFHEDLGLVNPPEDIPMLDSCLIVCNEEDSYTVANSRCNLQFNGYHRDDYIVTLTCGAPIPSELIDEYNSELVFFKNHMATIEAEKVKVDREIDSHQQEDGMIL